MEKTYKRVTFDIELAKDITRGKVKGRIYFETILADKSKTDTWIIKSIHDLKNEIDPYYVISECDNQEYIEYMNTKGYIPQQLVYAVIELPEEVPICNNPDSPRCKICSNIHCNDCQYNTPKHEFKPFDMVLVRGGRSTAIQERNIWVPAYYQHHDYSRYVGDDEIYFASGLYWKECIPYEGNEHLVGTTDNPKEN